MRSCMQDEIEGDSNTSNFTEINKSTSKNGFKRPRKGPEESSRSNSGSLPEKILEHCPSHQEAIVKSPFQSGIYSLRQRSRKETPRSAERLTPDTVKSTPKHKKTLVNFSGRKHCSEESFSDSTLLSASATKCSEELELCSPETMKLLEQTETNYAERLHRADRTAHEPFIYSFADTVCASAPSEADTLGQSTPPSDAPNGHFDAGPRTVLDFGNPPGSDLRKPPDAPSDAPTRRPCMQSPSPVVGGSATPLSTRAGGG